MKKSLKKYIYLGLKKKSLTNNMELKKSNLIYMNNSDLKNLSKSELIKLLLKQNARKPLKLK